MKINIEFNINSSYRDCIEVPEDVGLRALQIMDNEIDRFKNDTLLVELLSDYINWDDAMDVSGADIIEDVEIKEDES